jgi:hypothetical protein
MTSRPRLSEVTTRTRPVRMMNSVLDFSPCSTIVSPRLKRRLITLSAMASAWDGQQGKQRHPADQSRLDSIDMFQIPPVRRLPWASYNRTD